MWMKITFSSRIPVKPHVLEEELVEPVEQDLKRRFWSESASRTKFDGRLSYNVCDDAVLHEQPTQDFDVGDGMRLLCPSADVGQLLDTLFRARDRGGYFKVHLADVVLVLPHAMFFRLRSFVHASISAADSKWHRFAEAAGIVISGVREEESVKLE